MGSENTPKNSTGQIDKEKVKELFMSSPHVKWTPFAESHGWNPSRSRSDYPVSTWVAEKQRILATAAGERLADILFGWNSRWHRDVLETLDTYPAVADDLRNLIKKKIDEIASRPIAEVSAKELGQLASALRAVTDAAHKGRLMDSWSFDLADSFVEESQQGLSDEKKLGLLFLVRNPDGTNAPMSASELQAAMEKYMDKPIDA